MTFLGRTAVVTGRPRRHPCPIDAPLLPPPPPGPPDAPHRRHTGAIVAAIVAVVVVALLSFGLVRVGGTPAAAGDSPRPSATSSEGGGAAVPLPGSLDGQRRVTAGPMLQRMKGELPTLPIAGAGYDFAVYGSETAPTSVLLVIHGLGDVVDAMPSTVFFSSVGEGIASAFAGAGTAGRTLNLAGGVQASQDGADHDCLPLRQGADPVAVVCIFRVSGVIGMVMLLHESDPQAALAVSEEAARSVA